MFSVTRWLPLTPIFRIRREIDDWSGRVAGQTYGDGEGMPRESTWPPAVEAKPDA